MTIGLYPGSFDPPTLGHFDILQRAAEVCDQLIVGIGINPSKQAYLPLEERQALLATCISEMGLTNVTVIAYQGATVTWALANGVDTLIRGLRSSLDLNAERGMAEVNRLNGLDTCFLLGSSAHSHLSGQLVRGVVEAGLPLDGLVHPLIADAINTRHRQDR